jgi:hypothetical protein
MGSRPLSPLFAYKYRKKERNKKNSRVDRGTSGREEELLEKHRDIEKR